MPMYQSAFFRYPAKDLFTLAYLDSLHLFIFFHFQVYMIENESFVRGGKPVFFKD